MPSVNYFTVYHESCGVVGIHKPPLEEIVKAIQEIGNGNVYSLKLFKDYKEGDWEHYLEIFGEKGLYHISEWEFGDEVRGFNNMDIHPSRKVYIKGYRYSYQLKQFCTDLNLVVDIGKEFFLKGSLLQKAEWW